MANPISKLNLVINGTSTQLDIHDANALTTEIDSMGTGWVRFKSGLQICYGLVTNTNNLAIGITRHSFPKNFIATPVVIATPDISAGYLCTAYVDGSGAWVLNVFVVNTTIQYTADPVACSYVAIGKWN